MNAIHTPGPWSRGIGRDAAKGMDGKGYAICAGPCIIARVTGMGYPIGKGSHPESDANAKLIAAAPDLLDVLLKVSMFLHANYRDADMPDILPDVRAALEKAIEVQA